MVHRTNLAVAFLSAAIWANDSVAENLCTVSFIGAAGVRLRIEPTPEANAKRILKFNTRVCAFNRPESNAKTKKDHFIKVRIEGTSVEGWVKSGLLMNSPVSLQQALSSHAEAIAAEDTKLAIQWAERAVDLAERPDTLKLLEDALIKSGNKLRATAIRRMRTQWEGDQTKATSPGSKKSASIPSFAILPASTNGKTELIGQWVGLRCSNFQCTLTPTKIQLTHKKIQVGKEADELTDVWYLASDKNFSLVFQGLNPAIKTIREAKYTSDKFGGAAEVELEINGNGYSLETTPAGKVKLYLFNKRKMQELDGYGLAWAGDLDGDGRLDLILKTSANEGIGDGVDVVAFALFLSSLAVEDNLVGEASDFSYSDPTIPGC